ncbi:hypothetical protein HG530_013814 [Fusarium avenaceum]|nr:hypothetical protein HG530_013814 [Fusarium avenaceum]
MEEVIKRHVGIDRLNGNTGSLAARVIPVRARKWCFYGVVLVAVDVEAFRDDAHPGVDVVEEACAAGYAWFCEASPADEAFHFRQTPPSVSFVAGEKLKITALMPINCSLYFALYGPG